MRKISITEALVELKLYDKKINDAIAALKVLAVAGKKKKATDMGTFGTVADFEKKSKIGRAHVWNSSHEIPSRMPSSA